MIGHLPRGLRALLLVLPLVTFLAVFFAWPIWTMVSASVRNDGLADALPLTFEAIAEWTGEGIPNAEVQDALVEDLRAVDRITLGGAVRMPIVQVSGFRSLMPATMRAVQATDGAVDLAGVDRR